MVGIVTYHVSMIKFNSTLDLYSFVNIGRKTKANVNKIVSVTKHCPRTKSGFVLRGSKHQLWKREIERKRGRDREKIKGKKNEGWRNGKRESVFCIV